MLRSKGTQVNPSSIAIAGKATTLCQLMLKGRVMGQFQQHHTRLGVPDMHLPQGDLCAHSLAGEVGIDLTQDRQGAITAAINTLVDQVAVLNVCISTLGWGLHTIHVCQKHQHAHMPQYQYAQLKKPQKFLRSHRNS